MRFRAAGESGLLVELDDPVAPDGDAPDGDAPAPDAPALRLAAALGGLALPGVTDVVPAERTLLVRFDRRLTDPGAVERAARSATTAERTSPPEETVTVDVVYDGEDLAEAATLAGLTGPELVSAHTSATWRVMFSGFAPGFGYLRCDDRRLDVPRRDTARTRVPAGSVALAAGYSGVYPRSSPGGWQLIGRTDAPLWSLDRDPPALLRPGVLVRFRSVG